MSDLPQQITINQYTADGATSIFTYSYLILIDGDIDVYLQPAGQPPNPVTDIKTLGVDYTVQGAGNLNGGTVTFLTTPDNGDIVTLVRNVEASINTTFAQVSTFNGQNLDDAFERLMLVIQQNKTINEERNLTYIINDDIPSPLEETQLPVLGDQQIWQKVGGAIQAVTLEENPDVSTLRSQLLSEVMGSDGASIIGYYDDVNNAPQLLSVFLNNLPAYINNVVAEKTLKPGMMIDYAGTSAPAGFLLCDGSVVSQTTYASLYAAIGSTWNTGGEGAGNFRLPDFRRRVAVGSGGTGTATLGNATGNTGGEETHTQTIPELASHTHTPVSEGPVPGFVVQVGAGFGVSSGVGGNDFEGQAATESTGSSTPFNIIQPSNVVTKIIKT